MLRLTDTWITPQRAGWRHLVFVLCYFFNFLNVVTIHSILDLAATLFSAETPGLFCELKIFTHHHISIEVSTYLVDYA